MIYLKYNYYTDEYNISVVNYEMVRVVEDGILVDKGKPLIRMGLLLYYIDFAYYGDKFYCDIGITALLDININTERIGKLFQPVVDKYFETEDPEILVYIIRSLIPLLDRMILKQEHIDKFELPKLSTKSARNVYISEI
jgi:hypothetical protein